jgi:hypothetical protein
MAYIKRHTSVRSQPPGYTEKDMELGDMASSKFKFHKTGSTMGTGGYQDWEANAPHDPNHQGPLQNVEPPVLKLGGSPESLRHRIQIFVCHLFLMYAVVAFLLSTLVLYVGLVFVHARITVKPTIVINGTLLQPTAPGFENITITTTISVIVSSTVSHLESSAQAEAFSIILIPSSSKAGQLWQEVPDSTTFTAAPSAIVVTVTPPRPIVSIWTTITTTVPHKTELFRTPIAAVVKSLKEEATTILPPPPPSPATTLAYSQSSKLF